MTCAVATAGAASAIIPASNARAAVLRGSIAADAMRPAKAGSTRIAAHEVPRTARNTK